MTRWAIIVSSEGVLRLRPLGPSLTYEELQTAVERLVAAKTGASMREVVFDFGSIQTLEAPWTAVFALLIHFARRSSSRCRINGLSGQPARAATLLQRSKELRALMKSNVIRMPDRGVA